MHDIPCLVRMRRSVVRRSSDVTAPPESAELRLDATGASANFVFVWVWARAGQSASASSRQPSRAAAAEPRAD